MKNRRAIPTQMFGGGRKCIRETACTDFNLAE